MTCACVPDSEDQTAPTSTTCHVQPFIIERYRDTSTPVDCGRATNQVHRPKVKREKIQVPKCIRLIDKTGRAPPGASAELYSKWLEAEHAKKPAGSGYAKYGTKQDSIEGALEELNDMINHYNSICSMQKEKQQE